MFAQGAALFGRSAERGVDMGVNFEIYRAAAVAAQAQYELDKQAAKQRRETTVSALVQSIQVGSVFHENGYQRGFPIGSGSTDTFPTFQDAISAAGMRPPDPSTALWQSS